MYRKMKQYNKTRLPQEGDRLAEVINGKIRNLWTVLETGILEGNLHASSAISSDVAVMPLVKVRLDAWTNGGWIEGKEITYIDPYADRIRIVSRKKEEEKK